MGDGMYGRPPYSYSLRRYSYICIAIQALTDISVLIHEELCELFLNIHICVYILYIL